MAKFFRSMRAEKRKCIFITRCLRWSAITVGSDDAGRDCVKRPENKWINGFLCWRTAGTCNLSPGTRTQSLLMLNWTHLPASWSFRCKEKLFDKVLTRMRNKLIEFIACFRQHFIQHIFVCVHVVAAAFHLIESKLDVKWRSHVCDCLCTLHSISSNQFSHYLPLDRCRHTIKGRHSIGFSIIIFFQFNWIEEMVVIHSLTKDYLG